LTFDPRLILLALSAATLACAPGNASPRLTFSGSALGAEGAVIREQLARFGALHPGVPVELRLTPDAADQRHQLYVQWLNARVPEPDVLQLDIIWPAEFAAAGWIVPLPLDGPDLSDFFPAAIEASRWRQQVYAIPWFVDAGLLYWRTDILDRPPATVDELREMALAAMQADDSRAGLVWQGARYEGLVTVFLEHLTAFGGGILDDDGRVIVDEPPAIRALTFMRDSVYRDGIVPASALTWQEEHARFAFQNGQSAFMRNWPYAWSLLQDPETSRVAGRVAVAPFPRAEGGMPAAALGGSLLAVNRHSSEPELARALVSFLTAPEQMLERARVVGQLPARRSLFDTPALGQALAIPLSEVRQALDALVARPVTPVYSELSEALQVRVHRALTRQEDPAAALRAAAREIRTLLERTGLDAPPGATAGAAPSRVAQEQVR
jgi:multiple sugar transport system substrate-binding protein